MKIEIEAKERSVSLEYFYTESIENNRDNRFTKTPFLTPDNSRQKTYRNCVFWNSINHPSWRCLKKSNPEHKRTILKRNGLCFICFHKGTWLLLTLSCKGKHNTNICTDSKKSNDRSHARLSDQSNTANMNKNNTNPTDGTTSIFTSNATNNANKKSVTT